MRLYFHWHLEGLEHIPKDAAALVASNHLSYLDGLAVAYGVHRAGRRPRFLTKSGLFKGQSDAFFEFLFELAAEADAATRGS